MRRVFLCLVVLAFTLSVRANAQGEVPHLQWRTITTEHFRIHYEPQLEAWATQLASRMESVRSAVASRVGYTPPQIIDILVEDPVNQPNGSAWPSLTYPAMRFWATPPSPLSLIGTSRGWGEILSVHEYAHLAHLLRPSRKAFAFPLAVLSVVPLGPVGRSPAWVAEGYATLIEGELTGSGRPNGAMRPAMLRTMALEGFLPSYGALDATDRFNGGAMRYLVGSAYLEWLQAARGDSALPQLWRRVTARNGRKFPAAFNSTFGDSPDVLYGHFSAEVTRRAFEAKAELERRGLQRGTLVQSWNWNTGAPDVSPLGGRMVVRRASASDPGGIMLYQLAEDTLGARRDSTATAKRLKRDPLDLEDYRAHPRAFKRLAILSPVSGASYDSPRFFADGERVLVSRQVPMRDGRARSDLFVWNTKTNSVHRITRGAGIQIADPLPDGKSAVGVSCGNGTCSLVVVNLSNGATRMLAQGGIDRSYSGARVSSDGKRVVTSQAEGTRWIPTVIDIATGAARVVGLTDEASRFGATWENDSTLVVMSDAEGVITLERLPINGGERSLIARTLGATFSPEVGPDGRVWWLDLHARGWDLRVSDAGSAHVIGLPLDAVNFPATRRVETSLAKHFTAAVVAPSRMYGAGPFGAAFIAMGGSAADGDLWAAGVTFGDPVGRGTGMAYAGIGRGGSWSGARGVYTWRGFRPELQLQGYLAEYLPSEDPSKSGLGWEGADRAFSGAVASIRFARSDSRGRSALRYGASMGHSRNPTLDGPSETRTVGFVQLERSALFTPSGSKRRTVEWSVNHAFGESEGASVSRTVADIRLGMGNANGGLAVRARGGQVNDDAALAEHFYVGGTASPYMDGGIITNRVEHLGLPYGVVGGRRFGILTLETTGPVRLYHDWMVGGDDEFGESLRVLGAEFLLATIPRMAVMRVPNASLRAGLTHVLNGPVRNTTYAYLGLSVTP